MLISQTPNSKGKEAAIFRSRQLTDFCWTPLRDIPVYIQDEGKTKLPAGKELTGMIYSSPEPTDKFIAENISFETLLSILANPDSALYCKDLGGHNNSWPYFGIVCNGLVRYALNIQRRYSTKRWPTVPGMHKIADEECYTAEQIELCDILFAYGRGRNHVALITDILRDESGTIRQIEVSEAVRPVCVRRQYDVEVFFETYKLFALWRYDFTDEVPMPDAAQAALLQKGVSALPTLAVDYGNKTNYRTCEDVVISVFSPGENELEISCGGEAVERITLTGRGTGTRKFPRGYYTVRHLGSGECVEFCVTEPEIRHSTENGLITVTAESCDAESELLYMEFREKSQSPNAKKFYSDRCASLSKVEELTEEEKRSGIITREIPDDAENFKLYFQNKYGIWTHTMIRI